MGDLRTVGGRPLWFEVAGTPVEEETAGGVVVRKPPVVLLHGGLAGGDSWSGQLPALAERFEVFIPDRPGHGRTPDHDGPFTYEGMAAETIAFLEEVVGCPSHLVGWSDGGIVAIEVALTRPDLVAKLALLGANFHHDGLHPTFVAQMAAPDFVNGVLAAARSDYERQSPDGPEHWLAVVDKVLRLWQTAPTLEESALAAIDRPVLVLAGDDDCVRHEHTVALFEALPQGQLAIIPGSSHEVPIEKPDLVNQLLVDFLVDGTPRRTSPVRFAHDAEPAADLVGNQPDLRPVRESTQATQPPE